MACFNRRLSICVLSEFLLLSSLLPASPVWQHQSPGDPPLAVAALRDSAMDERCSLVVGYDSGEIACFNAGAPGSAAAVWKTKVNGSVLNLAAIPDVNKDGVPELAVATGLGSVACVSGGADSAGKILWSLDTTFTACGVVSVKDTNRDGVDDVAFGGADHRVHLVGGADGRQLWNRLLEAEGDIAYVDSVVNAGDLNNDGVQDLFVRTWFANRWALSGADGTTIWGPHRVNGLLATMANAGDLNGDGADECLQSGNDGVLQLCNGKDGAELWRCSLGRPLRAIAVAPPDEPTSGGRGACFTGNAEGKIARVCGDSTASTPSIVWTAEIGALCRGIVVPGDIDGDGCADIVAGAENGVAAALSGATGKELWRWKGPDVIRSMACVPDSQAGSLPRVAVACLDGTVALLPAKPDKPLPTLPVSPNPRVSPAAKPRRPEARTAATSQPVEEVPILLYHDVPTLGVTPSAPSPLALFREQMDLLVQGGYTAVSLDEIADWIEGKGSLPAKPVCITFDGQYTSHDTGLYPILNERGLFAISYVTSDWIGTPNHLDWHELRRLERSGVVQIENHTISHAFLPSVSKEEVVRQVKGCGEQLRLQLAGKVSRHHAYPDGPNTPEIRTIMKDLGFRTATTVLHRHVNRSDSVFNLPRYAIAEDMPLDTFKAIIRYSRPYPSLPYEYSGAVGNNWRQPSYANLDAEGKLWVCDYSANHVRVFLPSGEEASFSPISEGINQNGETIPMRCPSGSAVAASGEVLVTISSRSGAARRSGLVFRYRASDGKPLSGMDLPYLPGDADTDADGLVYIVDKLTGQWHVYTPQGSEVPGSPFGKNAGTNVTRGIAVTRDGTRVYLLSETSASIHMWRGKATASSARFEQSGILADKLSGCGGIDVLPNGTVLVGYYDQGMIVAYDAQNRPVGQISGGPVPSLNTPRGAAFSPDGKQLWIVNRSGQIQRWQKGD